LQVEDAERERRKLQRKNDELEKELEMREVRGRLRDSRQHRYLV